MFTAGLGRRFKHVVVVVEAEVSAGRRSVVVVVSPSGAVEFRLETQTGGDRWLFWERGIITHDGVCAAASSAVCCWSGWHHSAASRVASLDFFWCIYGGFNCACVAVQLKPSPSTLIIFFACAWKMVAGQRRAVTSVDSLTCRTKRAHYSSQRGLQRKAVITPVMLLIVSGRSLTAAIMRNKHTSTLCRASCHVTPTPCCQQN